MEVTVAPDLQSLVLSGADTDGIPFKVSLTRHEGLQLAASIFNGLAKHKCKMSNRYVGITDEDIPTMSADRCVKYRRALKIQLVNIMSQELQNQSERRKATLAISRLNCEVLIELLDERITELNPLGNLEGR